MSRRSHSTKVRDVLRQLREDGWLEVRRGPGDHVQVKHATKTGRVTIDSGAGEIPVGTLRNIYRTAGWVW